MHQQIQNQLFMPEFADDIVRKLIQAKANNPDKNFFAVRKCYAIREIEILYIIKQNQKPIEVRLQYGHNHRPTVQSQQKLKKVMRQLMTKDYVQLIPNNNQKYDPRKLIKQRVAVAIVGNFFYNKENNDVLIMNKCIYRL